MDSVGGSDPSSSARMISNGTTSCTVAQCEPSPGPACAATATAAAAHAAAKDGGKQNAPAHSTSHGEGGETSASDDVVNERLDRKDDHHVVSDQGGQNGGGPIQPIPAPIMQKIRRSGVRTKFMVESLRMEMITLQRQNAKLRRIVAMRLPDRSDVIFEDCCSVSASAAVAARESFMQRMAEELASLGINGDDSDDSDDDDEVGENLHLYVSPDDDMDDDTIKEGDEAAATDDKANGQMGR